MIKRFARCYRQKRAPLRWPRRPQGDQHRAQSTRSQVQRQAAL